MECITCVDLCDLSPVCGSSLLLADLSLNGGWQGGCGCVRLLDEYQVKGCCCMAILESLVKCNLFFMFLSIAKYVKADSFDYLYVQTAKPRVALFTWIYSKRYFVQADVKKVNSEVLLQTCGRLTPSIYLGKLYKVILLSSSLLSVSSNLRAWTTTGIPANNEQCQY